MPNSPALHRRKADPPGPTPSIKFEQARQSIGALDLVVVVAVAGVVFVVVDPVKE